MDISFAEDFGNKAVIRNTERSSWWSRLKNLYQFEKPFNDVLPGMVFFLNEDK